MVGFFTGSWHGKGQFANGKPIEADVSFRLSLDSAWLMEEHTDVPPNRYKSLGMWGKDGKTSTYTLTVFDNFSGQRKFLSDGWQDNKIAFSFHEEGSYYQRFTYEKTADNAFTMKYEVSKDGSQWSLGDQLLFERR